MRIGPAVVLATVAIAASMDVSFAAQRTFVSTNGSDAAACSISAPCRSFGAAITQTDTDGEIIVLDSGGYGPVMIDKSVAIRAPAGIYAGISVFADSLGVIGRGVIVDVPGGHVTLEGLTITGLGGAEGVRFFRAAELRLSRLQIQGLSINGISMLEHDGGALIVTDSVLSRNGSSGIGASPVANALSAVVVERCRFEGNFYGLSITGDLRVAHVRDSTFYRNFRGVQVVAIVGDASIDVENTLIAENSVGLFAQRLDVGQAQIRVARSTIVGNIFLAIEAQAASGIVSRGDNTLADNAGGEAFTGTYSPQ